jgi:hypothetical protein
MFNLGLISQQEYLNLVMSEEVTPFFTEALLNFDNTDPRDDTGICPISSWAGVTIVAGLFGANAAKGSGTNTQLDLSLTNIYDKILPTTNFCLECFISDGQFPSTTSPPYALPTLRLGGGSDNNVFIRVHDLGGSQYRYDLGLNISTNFTQANGSITLSSISTTTHHAIVRFGYKYIHYIDGVKNAEIEDNSPLNFPNTSDIAIGFDTDDGSDPTIDSVRFIVGSSLYEDTNFTAPNSELGYLSSDTSPTAQTEFLHTFSAYGDGDHVLRAIDNTNKMLDFWTSGSVGSGALVETNPSPMNDKYWALSGGISASYFKTLNTYSGLNFTGSDFTVSCYLLNKSTSSSGETAFLYINSDVLGTPLNGSINLSCEMVGTDLFKFKGVWADAIVTEEFTLESLNLDTNVWYWLSFGRQGSTFNLSVDAVTQDSISSPTITDQVGDQELFSQITALSNGYFEIDQLQILNGIWDDTAPEGPEEITYSTPFLMNYENGNGTTPVNDDTGARTLTFLNGTVSTDVSKFGTGSLKFSTSNGSLMTEVTSDLNISNGEDFTFETFVRASDKFNYTNVFGIYQDSASSGDYVSVAMDELGGNEFKYYLQAKSPTINTGLGSISSTLGDWVHLAIVGGNGIYDLYVDGQKTTTVNPGTYLSGSAYRIVLNNKNNLQYDSSRFLKGVKLYTQNFEPPAIALG